MDRLQHWRTFHENQEQNMKERVRFASLMKWVECNLIFVLWKGLYNIGLIYPLNVW